MAQIQVQHQAQMSGPNGVAAGASGNQFLTTSLYVGDLDFNVTDSQLYDLFSQVGQVLSVRVCRDLSTRRSLGYGYVNYANPADEQESAQNAIDKIGDKSIDHKALHDTFSSFGTFFLIATDGSASPKVAVCAIWRTKNLLKMLLIIVMRDGDGKSKCFGFVNFENADDAAKAVEALNGKKFDDREWYVGKAQKKSEREQELKGQFEQAMKETVDKFQGLNLYIKNLGDSIDDEKLKELFSEFGTITSCKVMRDPSGISKGSGFVAFSTPEEASRAVSKADLAEMNGKMIVSKPLYVAVAQRKEERRARLQAQFSQMRPVAMGPSVPPRMPMYPPGPSGLGQQFLYGQAPPAIIPQAGFGYQQQLVPGMRPAGAPMPNFFVPVVSQGQQGQRPGGRRGAGPVQQTQQPLPIMPHQVCL
ncbi:hypothetical protein CUMW_282240, partial [Citrus unshiu]